MFLGFPYRQACFVLCTGASQSFAALPVWAQSCWSQTTWVINVFVPVFACSALWGVILQRLKKISSDKNCRKLSVHCVDLPSLSAVSLLFDPAAIDVSFFLMCVPYTQFVRDSSWNLKLSWLSLWRFTFNLIPSRWARSESHYDVFRPRGSSPLATDLDNTGV